MTAEEAIQQSLNTRAPTVTTAADLPSHEADLTPLCATAGSNDEFAIYTGVRDGVQWWVEVSL